jgi:toxin HigB-1
MPGAHRYKRPVGAPVATCTGTRYAILLIKTIRHRGLRRLYEEDDPSRLRADQVDRISAVLAHLDQAETALDLNLPGYRLHALRGNYKGFWSVSISGNWRIIFRIHDGEVFDVDLVDYH